MKEINTENIFLYGKLIIFTIFITLFLNGGMKIIFNLSAFLILISIFYLNHVKMNFKTLNRLEISVLLFYLSFSISSLSSINPRVSLHQFIMLSASVFIFFLISNNCSKDDINPNLKFFFKMISIYVLISLIHFFLSSDNGFYFARHAEKLHFTMGHYNHFGTLLLFILPLPLLFKNKTQTFFSIIPIFFMILMTGSRSATGAAIIVIFYIIFTNLSQKFRLISIIITAILIIVLIVSASLINPELKSKFTDKFFKIKLSDGRGRYTIWLSALKIFKENPFFGAGPGNYPVIVSKFSKSQLLDAHNFFLNLLSETGISGFILFLITLYSALNILKNLEDRTFKTLLIAVFTGVFIQNLATSSLTRCGSLMMIFFFYLALVNSIKKKDINLPQYDSGIFIKIFFNGIILTILIFFLSLLLFKRTTPFLIMFFISLSFSLSIIFTCRKTAFNDLTKNRFNSYLRLIIFIMFLFFLNLNYRLSLATAFSFEANLHSRNGNYEKAIKKFSKSLKYDDFEAINLINLGVLYYREDEKEKSCEMFKKAEKLLPFDPVVINNLLLSNKTLQTKDNFDLLGKIDNSGYSELLQAYNKYEKNREFSSGFFKTAIEKNPQLILSAFFLEKIWKDKEFINALIKKIKPENISRINSSREHYGIFLFLAGKYEESLKFFPDKNRSLKSIISKMRTENRKSLGKEIENFLDRRIILSDSRIIRNTYFNLKMYLSDKSPLFLKIPWNISSQELFDYSHVSWLFNFKIDSKLKLEKSQKILSIRWPAPIHFAYFSQPVNNCRLFPRTLLPAAPLWMNDNYIHITKKINILPFIVYRYKNNEDSELKMLKDYVKRIKNLKI